MERDRQYDPQSNAEHPSKPPIEAIPSSLISIYPHGIERKRDGDKKRKPPGGINYEDFCFKSLVEEEKQHFLLGPRLIEHLFEAGYFVPESQEELSFSRPDIMSFQINSEKEWKLMSLSEMKSGGDKRLKKKFEGFTSLLRILRNDPDYLPDRFKQSIEEYIMMPSRIVIPSEEEVTVYIVSPSGGKSILQCETTFTIANIGLRMHSQQEEILVFPAPESSLESAA